MAKIVIKHYLLKSDKDVVFKTAVKDDKLIDFIEKKKEKLREENIETFNQVDNIIVTEIGYFVAVYDKSFI